MAVREYTQKQRQKYDFIVYNLQQESGVEEIVESFVLNMYFANFCQVAVRQVK